MVHSWLVDRASSEAQKIKDILMMKFNNSCQLHISHPNPALKFAPSGRWDAPSARPLATRSSLIHLTLIGPIAYDISYVKEIYYMTTLTATEARKRLYSLVDEVKESHDPIQIVGKRSSAVLISEEDWRAIQESLYLTSIPGMRESIKKGLKTPIEECDEDVGW
jgi:antitoxin YefM